MDVLKFFNALPGPCAQGLIWGIMAIGVYITYKVLDLADLTVDGTMATGGAVCIMMMQSGHSVWMSLFVAFLAGMAGRSGHRFIPYSHGNSGNSGRNPDPAGTLLSQSPYHGGKGNQATGFRISMTRLFPFAG